MIVWGLRVRVRKRERQREQERKTVQARSVFCIQDLIFSLVGKCNLSFLSRCTTFTYRKKNPRREFKAQKQRENVRTNLFYFIVKNLIKNLIKIFTISGSHCLFYFEFDRILLRYSISLVYYNSEGLTMPKKLKICIGWKIITFLFEDT